MDRKLRNRILLYLALAGVLAYVLVEMSGRKPLARVATATVGRENLVSSLSSNGKVEPIEPFAMRARLDTFVRIVAAKEGQALKKGQLLLELDVKDAAGQLAEARSKLARAQDDLRAAKSGGRADEAARATGDLAKAEAERDRLQKEHEALLRLAAKQAATQDELAANALSLTRAQAEVSRLTGAKLEFDRSVRLEVERAGLQVQQAQEEVGALVEKVRGGRIAAPVDGILYALPAKTGDFVKTGELLAEMADLKRVRVKVFVDEPELGLLETNVPVKITWDAMPSRSWTGKTEIIPKQVVPRGTRSVGELLCAVNNDKLELLPNTNVNVQINSKERLGVLAVPRGAVKAESGRKYVYLVRKNQLGVGISTLEKKEIRVGIADASNYEVVSGLQEGDLVALPGEVDLKDGMDVSVVTS
jgi:HlyD family secretion protein